MGNSHPGSSGYRHRKNVHWKSAEVPLPPGKPTATLGEGPEGKEGRLRWAPPRHDGGAPLQGYMVECNRIGSPIWVRTNPPLVLGPELILAGLETGYQYRFRVAAQNIVGLSNPSETSDILNVGAERSGLEAPVFHEGLHDVDSMENEKTEFKVYFDGYPVPTVAWFKDGFEVFSSRRTAILTDNNCSTLIFHQTSLNDEGEIKCTITNRVGHAVSRARLRLQAAPRVRLPRRYEDGLLFDAGETLQLKVAVAGKPTPHIQWRHDGQDLQVDSRIQITNSDKFTSLRIDQASRDDRGEYQVNATNEIGEDYASFLVTITAKPDPPKNPRAVREGTKSAVLTWDPPDDDGGCQIGNYIIEYYRTGWNVWLKATTERKLTATLSDLIEGSEYKFRIKAENPYGVSEPSTETQPIIIPGKSTSNNVMALEKMEDTLGIPPVMPRRKRLPSPKPEEEDSYYGEKFENVPLRKHRNLDDTDRGRAASEDKENRKGDKNKMGSSEFMLILYPDEQKSKEDKRKSFQLDLEDAMTPPTLSLSAPQLGANMCLMQPLRYSVSSTELLHEQAMNRMYQVMALKEAESAKSKRAPPKVELNSLPEKISPEIEETATVKQEKVELNNATLNNKWKINNENLAMDIEMEPAKSDESLHEDKSEENDLFDDDYTTSTVSTGDSEYSDSDSLEEGRGRRNNFDESNTYHPKDMIPKGIPEEDRQDIKIKPIPLPDPNFIPKPILKKREPAEAPPAIKEVKSKEPSTKSKPLLSKVPLLKRITKSQEDKKTNKKINKKEEVPKSHDQKINIEMPKMSTPPIKEPVKEEPILDGGLIVAERYDNLVKELGSNKRQQPMLYTNTEDLKKAAEEQARAEPEVKIKPKPPPIVTKKSVPIKKVIKQEVPASSSRPKKIPAKPIEVEKVEQPKKTVIQNHSPAIQTVTLPKNFSEINAEAESNVRNAFSYIINIFMVFVAAWLYIFKSELLAIPFLALAIYRELHSALKNKMPRWLTNRKQ